MLDNQHLIKDVVKSVLLDYLQMDFSVYYKSTTNQLK